MTSYKMACVSGVSYTRRWQSPQHKHATNRLMLVLTGLLCQVGSYYPPLNGHKVHEAKESDFEGARAVGLS